MGCGCAKKMANSKAKKANKTASKKDGNIIRKRRVSKLISIPGRTVKKKKKNSN